MQVNDRLRAFSVRGRGPFPGRGLGPGPPHEGSSPRADTANGYGPRGDPGGPPWGFRDGGPPGGLGPGMRVPGGPARDRPGPPDDREFAARGGPLDRPRSRVDRVFGDRPGPPGPPGYRGAPHGDPRRNRAYADPRVDRQGPPFGRAGPGLDGPVGHGLDRRGPGPRGYQRDRGPGLRAPPGPPQDRGVGSHRSPDAEMTVGFPNPSTLPPVPFGSPGDWETREGMNFLSRYDSIACIPSLVQESVHTCVHVRVCARACACMYWVCVLQKPFQPQCYCLFKASQCCPCCSDIGCRDVPCRAVPCMPCRVMFCSDIGSNDKRFVILCRRERGRGTGRRRRPVPRE